MKTKEWNEKIGHAPQTNKLENGNFLHFWYANNKNRGNNNCTIILSSSKTRATFSRNQSDVIASTKTSSWKGIVNFSESVRGQLGL